MSDTKCFIEGMNVSFSDAVRMNEPTSGATNLLVESKIKVWFRQARDREGGRKKRELAKSKGVIECADADSTSSDVKDT